MNSLIKSLLVVSLFGFIPELWIIEVPLILCYGAIKALIHRDYLKKKIRYHFQRAVRTVFPENNNSSEHSWKETLGLSLGRLLKVIWPKIAKGFLAFVLLFTLPFPWSILALYGLYRHNEKELIKILEKNTSSFYDLIVGVFKGTTQELSFKQVLRNVVLLGFLLVGGIYYSGELFLLDLALTMLQSMIVWIGLNSALQDFTHAFKTPLQMVSNNIGKIIGTVLGRSFAYNFMTGQVVGSLGPAVGQVQSTGLLSELLTPFFSPIGLRFSNMSFFGRLLSSDFAHFMNSIFTSVFFTHNMQLYGDFYGVIGPTHFQIFLLMGVGCLLGFMLERVARAFYDNLVSDTVSVLKKAHSYLRGKKTPDLSAQVTNKAAKNQSDHHDKNESAFTLSQIAIIPQFQNQMLQAKPYLSSDFNDTAYQTINALRSCP